MSKPNFKTMSLLVVGLALLLASSCNNNRNKSNKAQPINPYANNNGLFLNTNQVCSDINQKIGSIFTQSSTQLLSGGYSQSLDMNVKSFLSASMNPGDLGTISSGDRDQTGVRFEGQIKLDGSRNIVLDQSRVAIKVYDSYVGQYDNNGKQITPIEIYFDRAIRGQVDASGLATVTFQDNFGEVTFEGRLDQTQWSGTVSYINSASYDQTAPTRGTLGQFYIARCGIGL